MQVLQNYVVSFTHNNISYFIFLFSLNTKLVSLGQRCFPSTIIIVALFT